KKLKLQFMKFSLRNIKRRGEKRKENIRELLFSQMLELLKDEEVRIRIRRITINFIKGNVSSIIHTHHFF
ncbi:hypothetical protein ACMBCN_03090, partial [Candidatus Liberibacter asiaticus]|nr:hypothetical protein [Candidatus Liberibacter asiaticus]